MAISGEAHGGRSEVAHDDPDYRWAEFRYRIEQQRESGPDIYTRAHDNAFADFLDESPRLQELIYDRLAIFPALTPENVALRIPKSSQAMAMAEDENFPHGYETETAWRPLFERLVIDIKDRTDAEARELSSFQATYFMNLMLPVASNVSDRGKLLKAAALLHGKEEVSVIDIGCSLNHSLKRLALYEEGGLTYEPVDVVAPDGAVDPGQTAEFNHLTQDAPLKLAPSVGVDIFDASRDTLFLNWARSNSFYPAELLDTDRRERFERLAAARPPEVGYKFLDIASPQTEKFDRDFDVAYFSTMMYQLTAEEIATALENAHGLVKPDGLIMVQDFVDCQPGGEMSFYPKEDWQDWHYSLWVKDMAAPEAGFRKYFTAETGRVKKIRLEPALGRLAVARQLDLVPVSAPEDVS